MHTETQAKGIRWGEMDIFILNIEKLVIVNWTKMWINIFVFGFFWKYVLGLLK